MQSDKKLPKIEYKKILYTTDLSDAGRRAFPYAASIARRFNAQLTVFHVVETRDFEKYLLGYISEDVWADITSRNLEEAKQILVSRKRDDVAIRDSVHQFCDDAMQAESDQPVFGYEVKVETGEPVEKILDEAHSGGYDLVVTSKHGHRTSVKDAVMGDTARRLIRRCNIPVLIVPLED